MSLKDYMKQSSNQEVNMLLERTILQKLSESHRIDEMAAHKVSDYLYSKSRFIIYLRESCNNLLASDLGTNGKKFDIHNSRDVSKSLGVTIERDGTFKITRYYLNENKDIPVKFEVLKSELDKLNNL